MDLLIIKAAFSAAFLNILLNLSSFHCKENKNRYN